MTMANTSAISVSTKAAQPWLSSPLWDGALIIAPALVSSAVAILFREQINNSDYLPTWIWVSFVLFVDVAHVYATGWRTYFNEKAVQKYGFLLVAIPIACWAVGAFLYSFGDLIFWRTLAYLAVFHFIRQQFGFMVLYSRKDPDMFKQFRWLDCACIYAATIYPLLSWHTHLPRNFVWFIDGDFVAGLPAVVAKAGFVAYALLLSAYAVKEISGYFKTGFFNLPRNLILVGTAVSWWVGMVMLNSDIAFTMTNVLSHGIPYMALIWLYHHRAAKPDELDAVTKTCSFNRVSKLAISFAPVFVLTLIAFAYIEEGFWDGFIWREHTLLFAPFAHLPAITDRSVLALLVPLLALPQSTHYVLDGFIWRVKERSNVWSA